MAMTEFSLNHDLAVKRYSNDLAVEAEVKQYFRKFMGKAGLIKTFKDLTKAAGDKITYGLRMKLDGDGIEGDNVIEGTSAETALDFYADSIYIDQRRKGTKSKGRMSEQRVPYAMRKEGKDALSTWFAEDYDQQVMMYLAGARGVNADFHVDTSWTGRANNTLTAPDSDHIIYGGNASASTDIDENDKMHLNIIERLVAKLETSDPMIQPIKIDGENKYVLLMHTWQAYDLRTSLSEGDWLDIQKSAGSRGEKNLVYQNSLGEYADMILHKHRYVIRFSTYGATGALGAARALCLGQQAATLAWGGGGGPGRYTWNEEKDDRGNALAITAGTIYGVKACTFNSKRFGMVAVDTYCDDPNS